MLPNRCHHLLTRNSLRRVGGCQDHKPHSGGAGIRTQIFCVSCPGITCFSQKARAQSFSSLKPQRKDEKEIYQTVWHGDGILVLVLFFCIDQNIYKGHILLLCQGKKNSKKWQQAKKRRVKYVPRKASSTWLLVNNQNKQHWWNAVALPCARGGVRLCAGTALWGSGQTSLLAAGCYQRSDRLRAATAAPRDCRGAKAYFTAFLQFPLKACVSRLVWNGSSISKFNLTECTSLIGNIFLLFCTYALASYLAKISLQPGYVWKQYF